MGAARELVHATAITVAGRAALIVGPSGAGKSDLALRCLAVPASPLFPETAALISDDQVWIEAREGHIHASAPATLAGKLEVRGVGIVRVAGAMPEGATVALVADLSRITAPARMPDPWPSVRLLGIPVPVLYLSPFEASAPLKLLCALASPCLPSDA